MIGIIRNDARDDRGIRTLNLIQIAELRATLMLAELQTSIRTENIATAGLCYRGIGKAAGEQTVMD